MQENKEQKKSGMFSRMAMNQLMMFMGGPKGITTKVSNFLIEHETKFTEFIVNRQKALAKEGLLNQEIGQVLSFSFTQEDGVILILEIALMQEGNSLKAQIIKRYFLDEFTKMISDLVDKKTKEDGELGGK